MINDPIEIPGVQLAGQFVLQVENIYSGNVSDLIVADNMLLDQFYFTWLGNNSPTTSYFNFCDLDGSATAVTAGDTTITKVGPARVGLVQEETLVTLGVGQWKSGRQYTFAVAAAAAAVNAVAIYSAASGGILVARAVLPSTLNLIIGDILTVKHYVTATVDPADRTGTMVLDGSNYPYTLRWHNFDGPFEAALNHGTPWNVNNGGSYNVTGSNQGIQPTFYALQTQNLPSVNATLSPPDFPSTAGDINTGVLTIVPQTYVASSFYRDVEFVIPYGQGNAPLGWGNLIFLMFGTYAPTTGFFFNFGTTRVPKDNTKEFRVKLRFTWGR